MGLIVARSAGGSDSGEIGGWVGRRRRQRDWFVDQRSWVGLGVEWSGLVVGGS